MAKKIHDDSDFVVCRACHKYFFVHEIMEHQKKEHEGYKYKPEDDPYRRFYYLKNVEVAWSLNRAKEIKDAINAVRLLVL